MRDPHIIIGAYMERHREPGTLLTQSMRQLPSGVWVAHVSDSFSTLQGATGKTPDEAMQRLAQACDPAQHLEFPHAR